MDQKTIEKKVEDYLNRIATDLSIDFHSHSSFEAFRLHTIKRLKYAFDLFSNNESFLNDFMLALRDYLLIFDTDILLPDHLIPNDNVFSIVRDQDSGRYFSSFQFPSYVNQKFALQAFQQEMPVASSMRQSYNLYTDPLIYHITGYTRFKSMAQKLAVYGALNTPYGYTTLVSLPTGGGKSLITQTMSYQQEGLTIVIVPTVSLAIDQERVAHKIIKSSSVESEIFSYHSGIDSAPILSAIEKKTARMLFISPEALLNNAKFNDVIQKANQSRYLKNIIIDEAHIVVDWGASFRVDYQCLESWRKKLMLTNPQIRTILLSATYEQHCINILKSFFSSDKKWIEVRCDSLRHEPRYIVVEAKSHKDQFNKMFELVTKLPHPMIIYTSCPQEADFIKDYLSTHGICNVNTFTGLTKSDERRELIDAWVDDQFEIMVATSAFGVGVDKGDVRTVLHMYIPQNANAYYQELGRGGRDRLPCLSVVCFRESDVDTAFGRISKRVMTTEKIVGRWDSMYNSMQSVHIGNQVQIDTSIKPNYSTADEVEDIPSSKADINWNIYVLLLLRRYNLIEINDVIPSYDKYLFIISILNDHLLVGDDHIFEIIDKIRTEEWDYYNDAFQLMKSAIKNRSRRCWSEMFFDTYDKVFEYCAGCNTHDEPDEGDFFDFSLKIPVRSPLAPFEQYQLSLFGDSKELIVFSDQTQFPALWTALLKKRLSTLVVPKTIVIDDFLAQCTCKSNLLIIDSNELRDLLKKPNYYYVSGMVGIVYSGAEQDIYNTFRLVNKCFKNHPSIRIVHILSENIYFSSLGKSFTDLVQGPVIPLDLLCN